MARVTRDPDRVAPTEFASFQKVHGDEGRMAVGDEFVVRMPGPWDGPVRVVERHADSFRLATLDGHLEAGQIEFRAAATTTRLVFDIESWARSGDRLEPALRPPAHGQGDPAAHVDLVPRARVELAGGRLDAAASTSRRGGCRRRSTVSDARRPGARAALDELHARPLNFDPERAEPARPESGWHVDDLRQPLPAESPGPPRARRQLGGRPRS